MSWIYIEAEDVLFFRDTRSFGRGEDHLAHCIFPPFPGTIAGAIRSRIVGGHPNWDQKRFNDGADRDIYYRIGSPDELGPNFKIRGPFLARIVNQQAECFSPIPADAYFKDRSKRQFGCLQPFKAENFIANWPQVGLYPLWPPGGIRQDAVDESYWLSSIAMRFYQTGGVFTGEPEGVFFQQDNRIGIQRDEMTGGAKDLMLYSAPFIHLHDNTGLLVWVPDEVGLPQSGILALGGESRAANYYSLPENKVNLMPAADMRGKTRVKVVLQTPSYFKGGWQPLDGDWSALGLPAGANLRAAALGRPLILNGWDIARGRQKNLRSFVPAGSVYYFEWDQPLTTDLVPHQVILTESPIPGNYQGLGLGQIALSSWDWQP